MGRKPKINRNKRMLRDHRTGKYSLYELGVKYPNEETGEPLRPQTVSEILKVAEKHEKENKK